MQRLTDDHLVLQRVYRWERERAQQILLTQPHSGGKVRDWTWAQAAGEARRVATFLASRGWEPGSRVAILSRNCAWWVMADLAVWMAGHVTVPIYPSLKPHSVRHILEHSGARACFVGVTDEKEAAFSGIPPGVERICLPTISPNGHLPWDQVIEANTPLRGEPVRPAEELATIIYTSGTTGIPKGVMHNFAALSMDAMALSARYQLTAEQRVLSYLPLAHIVERVGIEVTSLYLGSRVFFTEGIETFLTDLHRARPTTFLSVPRLLLKFQQGVFAKIPKDKLDKLLRIPLVNWSVKRRILRQLGLSTVQHAACGAAPLAPEILLWYRNLGLELAEGYGLTETLITNLPVPGTVRPGFVGSPIEGVEAKLSEQNELLLRSFMNMMGYYRDPEGTQNAFTADGFFRTGDIAQIDSDGQVKIIGRIKEQFKTSKGKYVAPAPIESKLVSHPSVEACCLMGAGMPSPFAVVLLAEDVRRRCQNPAARAELEQSLGTLIEEVNAQLDPHERVNFVAIASEPWTIGNGMMTPTLKIKRPVLESRYQPFIDGWRQEARPVVWEPAS